MKECREGLFQFLNNPQAEGRHGNGEEKESFCRGAVEQQEDPRKTGTCPWSTKERRDELVIMDEEVNPL